jgi:TolB-like protein
LHVPSILAPAAFLVVLVGPPARAADADGPTLALLPVQDRAGDQAAAAVVDATLRRELGQRGRVLSPQPTRDALRRLRIRNGDRAVPRLLRLLGERLGADWLVSATLHDAERRSVPRVTVSARFYSGATGRLVWAGFEGGSGLDHQTVLGFGVIHDLDTLSASVAQELLRDLPEDPEGGPEATGAPAGTLAIVPFGGHTVQRATAHAETVTEASRAVLLGDGTRLLSPNSSFEILRRLQAGQWGGVTAETREALRQAEVDAILTGAVEFYEETGAEAEPNPRVGVTMRLVDAASGQILWTGAEERTGHGGLDLLGLGRVRSRGALAERIVESLTRRLRRETHTAARHSQGEP